MNSILFTSTGYFSHAIKAVHRRKRYAILMDREELLFLPQPYLKMNKSIKTALIQVQTRNGNLLKTSLPWPVFFRLFPDKRIKMSYWINKSVTECLELGDASKLERTKQENVECRQGAWRRSLVVSWRKWTDGSQWERTNDRDLPHPTSKYKGKAITKNRRSVTYVRQRNGGRLCYKNQKHVGLYRNFLNVAAFV